MTRNYRKIVILSAILWQSIIPLVRAQSIPSKEYNTALQHSRLSSLKEKTPKREKRFGGIIIGIGICKLFCSRPSPDTTPPVVSCPSIAPTWIADEGKRTAFVRWNAATANDNRDGKRGIKLNSPLQGPDTDYREGSYTIIYTSQDKSGNIGSCVEHFNVVVRTCELPITPDGGRVSCESIPLIFGHTCSFSCDNGYKAKEQVKIKCLEDGIENGENFECKEITCGPPAIPENAKLDHIIGCTHEYLHNSVCRFECKSGYFNPDDDNPHIKCQDSEEWTNTSFSCVDASPPEIRDCPISFTAYVGIDQMKAFVNYTPPTAYDTTDGYVAVEMVHGISPASHITLDRENPANNRHNVEYTAKDSHGHEVERPCVFHIDIEEITCPMLEWREKLIIDCTSPLSYGATCTFRCSLEGYPRIGPEEVFCDRKEGDPPTGFWNWGDYENQTYCGVVECPDLPVPLNGAISCVPISTGKHCQMFCHKDYDIPVSSAGITGEFVCDDAYGWLGNVNVPDCSERRYPRNSRLPGELHYFSANCSDLSTQDEIKNNVIQILNITSMYRNRCINFPGCSIENIEVSCGSTSAKRKKRSTMEDIVVVRFDITVPIDPQGKDVDTYYRQLEQELFSIYDLLDSEIQEGKMDIDGLETDKSSFTYDYISLICEAGMQERISTFSCVGCPTGQMYDSSEKKCVMCPIGTYQDEDAQLECKMCDAGYSTRDMGSRNQSDCIAMCNHGYYSRDGVEPCQPCEKNSYQNRQGQTKCIPCPVGTNTSTQASSSVLNCTSDADVCDGVTCNGKGSCWEYHGSYKCTCIKGYSGENCTVPPDPCEQHLCQNNSPCVSKNNGYTCTCGVEHSGKYCELTKACKTFRKPYGVIVYYSGDREKNATLTCLNGKLLQPQHLNFLTCSENTGYEWNPSLDNEDLPKCVETAIPNSLTLDNRLSYVTNDDIATELADQGKTVMDNLLQSSTCVQTAKCKTRTIAEISQGKQKKRSLLYTVQIVQTVVVNFNFEDYFSDGFFHQSIADKTMPEYKAVFQDLEKFGEVVKNATEDERLDIVVNGISYSPEPSSLIQSGVVGCPNGMVSTYGICEKCAPGSYETAGKCQKCNIGTYQELEGQILCTLCPPGYTTARPGAFERAMCFTQSDSNPPNRMTSPAKVESTTYIPNIKIDEGSGLAITVVVALVVSALSVFVIAVLGFLCYCKITGQPRKWTSRSRIQPSTQHMNKNVEMNDYPCPPYSDPRLDFSSPPVDQKIFQESWINSQNKKV